MYREIYDEEGNLKAPGLSSKEEENLEWVIPETEADVEEMMMTLKELGYSG